MRDASWFERDVGGGCEGVLGEGAAVGGGDAGVYFVAWGEGCHGAACGEDGSGDVVADFVGECAVSWLIMLSASFEHLERRGLSCALGSIILPNLNF